MFTLIALIISIGAEAAPRMPAAEMPCAQIQQTVQARGSALLQLGPHRYLRVVHHIGHCALGEVLKPAWVSTKDDPRCFVGYVCSAKE